ncbi:MAG TPA: hypothetical protein PK926_04125 [Spirochaetota bacterium]|nr:hypothetical protein [Spirochaetota bacterium]HPI89157.1 hypothetical protein [Spirochaetota bacterium]HPR46848.1 hypothetical protein [Spirochaetota bacterium]
MLLVGLFLLLFLSFTVHILIVVFYVVNKSKTLFYAFLSTAFLNVSIAMVLSIVALSQPERIRHVDFKFILWILSGFVMVLMLILKIYFFRAIYLRSKDPDYYHLNYFGKKVLNKGFVKQYEFFTFFLSIPFFLLMGAYFVARLINLIRHGSI